jgi:hypothetical protein
MTQRHVAISVKQPWAALLVTGVKSVEVRTWATRRRGLVYVHASKLPDDRPQGWDRVTTPELEQLAALRGGLIGACDLTDCRRYDTAAAFAADAGLHLNAPDWFLPPRLFGFVFRNPRPIAYHPCTGQTMFFGLDGFAPADVT